MENTIGTAWVDLRANMAPLNRGLAAAQTKMQTAAAKMQTIGNTMSMAITLPLTIAGTAAYRTASQFDESMTRIQTLIGLTGEEVENMKGSVRELGVQTGHSGKEMADAMFFVQSAGQRGAEAMGTLEASAKAAALGLGDVQTVADAATSAMNAFGDSISSGSEAVSVMVATVREGKVQADGLAQVIGRVIPMAAELGMEFHEVGAAIATMSRTSGSARQSATALRGIFRALIKPSEQATKAAEEYGLNLANVRDVIERQGLLTGLQRIRNAVGDNEEAMAAIFPRVRGLTGVLQMVGKNADDTEEIFKNLADTSAEDLDKAFAQISKEKPWFALRQSISRVKDAFLSLGDVLIPYILPAFVKIEQAVKSLQDAFDSMSGEAQAALVKLLAALAIVGPALKLIGYAISTISGVVGSVISAFGGLSSVMSTVGGALTTLIGHITTAWGVMSSLVMLVWEGHAAFWASASAGAILKTALAAIGSALASVATALLPVIALAGVLYGVFEMIWDQNKSVGENLQSIWEKVKSTMVTAWNIIKTAVTNAWEIIKPVFNALKNLMAEITKQQIQGIIEGFSDMEASGEGWAKVLQKLSEFIAKHINKLTRFIKEYQVAAKLSYAFSSSIRNTIESINNLGNAISDNMKTIRKYINYASKLLSIMDKLGIIGGGVGGPSDLEAITAGTSAIADYALGSGNDGGGQPIQNNVYLETRELAKGIATAQPGETVETTTRTQ